MGLTNAERQKRYREKRNDLARSAVMPDVAQRLKQSDGAVLTALQRAERDAVMSEPIWPTPKFETGIDRFMGWSRYDWSAAPMELIDYFGMRSAREGWDAEKAALQAETNRLHAERNAYVARIIDECGDAARKILARGGGNSELTRAYEKDPTLGVKPKTKKASPVT